MSQRPTGEFNLGRKLLLAAVGVACVAGPSVFAFVIATRVRAQSARTISAPSPSFEAASIKVDRSGSGRHSLSPNLPGGRLRAINVSLAGLMTAAYETPASRIFGAPAWFDSEYFDIEATSEADNSGDENRVRLKTLLADRFKLVIHRETRQLPIYALVLATPGKLGPQLHPDDGKCDPLPGASSSASPAAGSSSSTPSSIKCGDLSGSANSSRVRFLGRAVTMNQLLMTLAGTPSNPTNPNVDRPIVDRTGLTGVFDFTLEFAPFPLASPSSQPGADSSAAPPSLFTALQEQLGLKLGSQMGPVDVLVIDHVEQPSEN